MDELQNERITHSRKGIEVANLIPADEIKKVLDILKQAQEIVYQHGEVDGLGPWEPECSISYNATALECLIEGLEHEIRPKCPICGGYADDHTTHDAPEPEGFQ